MNQASTRILESARRDFATYHAENTHAHDDVDLVEWFTDRLPVVLDETEAERFLEGLGDRADEQRRQWHQDCWPDTHPTCGELVDYIIRLELYSAFGI
jgi:hypothetical protein